MKRMALFIIAALVFSIFAPRAQAQPFADVPTDIFAFDAVAELAAKGIIEGYPDGTFKGDRAMTRYEMAMVVARLLARIEAIKIPPAAPAAQVTKADVDRLQRLLNEFRAELAAQGVRVTAVEEELAAIRAKLSNVRITGNLLTRYTISSNLPSPLGPDGRVTNTVDASPFTQYRNRLTFTGQAASNVRAVVRLNTSGGATTSSFLTLNTAAAQSAVASVGVNLAYVDVDPLFGIAWRLGRQLYTLAPVGLSNYGLLFDPANSNFGPADGLLAKGTFGGFSWELGGWPGSGPGAASCAAPASGCFTNQPGTTQFVNTFYTGSVSLGLIPGWPLRVSALSQQRNGSAGANPNTSDFGWAVDASGNLIPGVGFGAAYANFSGYLPGGATQSSNAWTAWLNFDLGALSGMTTFSPKLGFQYKNYGPTSGDYTAGTATMPAITGAITETYGLNYWNFQGWAATLGLKFTPDLSGTFTYESGTTLVNSTGYGAGAGAVASGSQVTEWYATFDYSLATATTLSARYFRRTVANSDSSNFYRVQLTYNY